MDIGSENNYSFLFIASLPLCVSLSPWKEGIQGLGKAWQSSPDAPLLPGTRVLAAVLGKLKTSISKPGALQFPMSCGPCTHLMFRN